LDILEKTLSVFELKGIRQFKVGKYKIDYYLPSLNIAIEYDENKHKGYTYEQQTLRQKIIERELGCSFIRVDDSKSHNENIGIALKDILNRKGEYIKCLRYKKDLNKQNE